MPFEIRFENVPAGVAASAALPGETLRLRTVEFVSEEDGDALIERLEGFGSDILARIPSNPPVQPKQVEHLLAIIRRDRSATVYLNELAIIGTIQVKREFQKGEAVSADDIADVHRLEFEGLTIPPDAGVVYIFSVGWRRAIFYDLAPLTVGQQNNRDYDINAQLAQFYAYLIFQKRFKIGDEEWQRLLDGQWFPFITLKESTIKNLVSHAANGWPLDDLVDSIAQEVRADLPRLIARWQNAPAFQPHLPFLERAVEHFQSGDHLSVTSILYPRIEGILRTFQRLTDPDGPATQKGLSGSAIRKAESERHASSPLLPAKFREYLERVYFASFDPNGPKITASRNSVGHGVAAPEDCSLKAATVSLLLVDQLCYCFSPTSKATVEASGSAAPTDSGQADQEVGQARDAEVAAAPSNPHDPLEPPRPPDLTEFRSTLGQPPRDAKPTIATLRGQ